MKKRVSFSTQQLVVDEDGTMVVEEMPADCTTTYDVTSKGDEHIKQPLTRSKRKHSQGWSKLETDLFYEVLGGAGTDFALMNDYITDRTRLELKKKFRHEQKADSERVSQVLSYPCMLDEELQERVDCLLEKIPVEKDYLHSVAKRKKQAARKRTAHRLGTKPAETSSERAEEGGGASETTQPL